MDAYGKVVVEECKKFDEKTKQKIHDYIQQQVSLNPVEHLKQDGKPKKRRSVIKRLHQKQIAITRRFGKPIPKYLDQEMGKKAGIEYAKVKV